MTSNSWKVCATALLPSLATMFVVQACGGSGDAQAQGAAAADPIEGVWESVVTRRDCSSGAAIGSFRGAQVFHRGGTLTDTDASTPGTRGPGQGSWTHNADGSYTARFRFFRFNGDGSLAGSSVVTRSITLQADGNNLVATTRAEIRDPAGAVLQTVCLGDVTTRFN